MESTQVLELMGMLKLYRMCGAYDEVMAAAIKRQHEPPKIIGGTGAGMLHPATATAVP